MKELIDVLVTLGGLIAAAAVSVMCGVCLLVWLGGLGTKPPSETWRQADEL